MSGEARQFAVNVEAQAMREARAAVERFAAEHGLPMPRVEELGLAVSEAMFNAMDHGSLVTGAIQMECRCRNGAVEVSVETGCRHEERTDLEEQIHAPLPSKPPDIDLERGRGLYLIRVRTDRVFIEEVAGSSLRLVLVKQL